MDLLSTVRKQGSRGGVNFSWDEVATSAHRENYLGHSVKAPVGRWAQGRDLTWYAKADSKGADPNETDDERNARERREEIRKIKEAEEDAIAKALGLPPTQRDTTGANSIEVPDRKVPDTKEEEFAKAARFLRREGGVNDEMKEHTERKLRDPEKSRRRHRSRNRERESDRQQGRERSPGRDKRRHRSRERTHRDDKDTHVGRRVSRDREDDNYRPERRSRPNDHEKLQDRARDRSRSRGAFRRKSPHRRRSRSPA